MEIWKDIEGYQGQYQVSNYGRVKSLARVLVYKDGRILNKKEIILKLIIQNTGYLKITLYGKIKPYQEYIHRLVALAFIPNPENKPQVNHDNGIKTDNHVSNLEWSTKSENCQHAVDSGLCSGVGETHYDSKLSKIQVLEIREKYVPRKYSTYKLAKEYDVHQSTIHRIINDKIWKHI